MSERLVLHAVVLSGIAFGLHSAWEFGQCSLFYVHKSFDASAGAMLRASLGDVVITWILYGGVALLSRNWRWTRRDWKSLQWLALVTAAVIIAVGVELHALTTGRWSYSPVTPLVPGLGISLIPIVQLVVVTSAACWLADRLLPGGRTLSETEVVRRRYDRIAPVYDLLEFMMELVFRPWRRQIWRTVEDEKVLEVGVGTGKNLRFWPRGARIVGTDISERMLARAASKAKRLGINPTLAIADVQKLPYDDNRFDIVIASFLFCSVPDPILGLREVLRVLKPGGRLILLEHVMSKRRVFRLVLQLLDPISYQVWGAHLDRDTADNTRRAGFANVSITKLWVDFIVRIDATKSATLAQRSDTNVGVLDSTDRHDAIGTTGAESTDSRYAG